MLDLYKVLEVSKKASKDEIKKAYRKKASKAHPDKGGSPEEFKPIALAYEVLSNDTRREQYDRTGEYEEKVVDYRYRDMLNLLSGCLSALIDDASEPTSIDLIKGMKDLFKLRISQFEKQLDITKKQIKKLTRLIGCFEIAEGEQNLLEMIVISGKIKPLEEQLKVLEKEIDNHKQCYDYLNKAKFNFDPKKFSTEGDYISIPPSTEWLATLFGVPKSGR